jgi:hypothetical protein
MNKEIDLPNREMIALAQNLAGAFLQRRDLYAVQLMDGRYACVRKPLKAWHVWQHLEGEMTLGAYAMDAHSRTRFAVIDADDEESFKGLIAAQQLLARQGATGYLETSRRGGHLWMFFQQPVSGKEARAFGKGVLASVGLSGIELFPKQDSLKDGPGSLIRLPFGVHRKTGQRYGFIDPAGQPLTKTLTEQARLLCQPVAIPGAVFEAFREQRAVVTQNTENGPAEKAQGTLSQRIKDSVSVFDFVIQYVELGPNGVGRCPFHADEQASFAVNAEGNYWHCFAGCGGGSIIDFWMKWHKCEFKQALKELAGMLLPG